MASLGLPGGGFAATGDYSVESDWGKNLSSQAVRAAGTAGDFAAREGVWAWNLGYNYQVSTTPGAGTVTVVDNTTDLSGGMGWTGVSGWGAAFTLDYSRTPAENLLSQGSNLVFSREWGRTADSGPVWNASLNAGTTNYVEQFVGTVARPKGKVVPVSGSSEIRQFVLGLGAVWQPPGGAELGLAADFYGYTRSVAAFQNALNSPLGLNRGLGSFGNTVGGFPIQSFVGTVKVAIGDAWDNDFSENFSFLAAGWHPESDLRDVVNFHFGSGWRASAGVEYETSVVLTAWIGILGLGWGF